MTRRDKSGVVLAVLAGVGFLGFLGDPNREPASAELFEHGLIGPVETTTDAKYFSLMPSASIADAKWTSGPPDRIHRITVTTQVPRRRLVVGAIGS